MLTATNESRSNVYSGAENENSDDDLVLCAFFSMLVMDKSLCDSWILDSGASKHLCFNKSLFTELHKSNVNHIIVANNQKISVEGEGSIYLKVKTERGIEKIKLLNVLYIPNLWCNLISVSCITKSGLRFIFDEETCEVINKEKNQVLLTGKVIKNGVYVLDHINNVSNNNNNNDFK